MDTFLNLNYERTFFAQGTRPLELKGHHRPYFLASLDDGKGQDKIAVSRKREELAEKVRLAHLNSLESSTLARVTELGPVEEFSSFFNFGRKRFVFRVFTKRPGDVPAVSNHLFYKRGMSCYEFDIPYEQRALTDLAAEEKFWVFDTGGKEQKLKVLAYDIETLSFSGRGKTSPIDIIGYGDFELSIRSSKDLGAEEFDFDITRLDGNWQDREIHQLVAPKGDIRAEIKNIHEFIEHLKNYDIITGHNIIDFDNQELYNRVVYFLKDEGERLSSQEHKAFREFLDVWAMRKDSYHFGKKQTGVYIYPSSFDTFHAARRFYRFLESFSLKAVAPFLGVKIPNRKYLDALQGWKLPLEDWKLYNKHDVREQLGVSMILLPQALPLSFSTGMPLEMVLTGGTTSLWDFMAMIRGSQERKLMPPIHRAVYLARTIKRDFGTPSRQEISHRVRSQEGGDLDKTLVKFAKYGEEMPDWVEKPHSIFGEGDSKASARHRERRLTSYSIPGGMTIHPDTQAGSHLLPWWQIVAADVGAMYPTILRGMNFGADTVRMAEPGEKPDHWIWVKRADENFVSKHPHVVLTPEGIANNPHLGPKTIRTVYGFADHGYLLGIRCSKEQGLVNRAMAGIMKMIWKIKRELKETSMDSPEHQRLSMMYQSVKGVRNAGTHGILIASGVGCRQFNVWGGAAITTKGQEILHDVMRILQDRKMRVVYGDTDGIYIAASTNATLLPELKKPVADFIKEEPGFLETLPEKRRERILAFLQGKPVQGDWLSQPDDILSTIQKCNERWREKLSYEDFELEPEVDTAMVFVKHKNYLIFNVEDGELKLQTKGNNFKGSDKAEIARRCLATIMKKVLFSHLVWSGGEGTTRKKFTQTLKNVTTEEIKKLSTKDFKIEELHLVQGVSPPKSYATNKDGSPTAYGKRAAALEKLRGEKIRATRKFRFVVSKRPLPGIERPTKSGVKPIDYMWPVEMVKPEEIDLEWYRDMVANYVRGAFGLKDLSTTTQFSLMDFM